MLCRTALHLGHEHPEITFRTDRLLCSINERLGALCFVGARWLEIEGSPKTAQWVRDHGYRVEPLGTDFLEEIQLFNQADHEDFEEMREGIEDG